MPIRCPNLKPIATSRLLLAAVAGVFTVGGGAWLLSGESDAVRSHTETRTGPGDRPAALSLRPGEQVRIHDSAMYRSNFGFNAIAPHWRESVAPGATRAVFVRTSSDGRAWTGWFEIETEGPMREGDRPDEVFASSPLFVEGKFFQYRIRLGRSSAQVAAPSVSDLKVSYLDSRLPLKSRISAAVKDAFTPQPALAAGQGPHIVSRAGWGSPDPRGELFQNDPNKHWQPSYKPVKQVFIHHTVNANVNSDPAAVVRGIWHFHTYTRGWGDIGYNYLLDHNGRVYEGRFGGDNVVAGHTYGYNPGSLGVAMIGCYESTSSTCKQLGGGTVRGPGSGMWSALTTLLSWKTTNFEIDPLASQTFCRGDGSGCRTFPTIAGHRDADGTACPGNLVYDNLPNVRNDTSGKSKSGMWSYSAKQESYQWGDLSGPDTQAVTFRFKNTGTGTWSNTGNPMVLKTAVPHNRTSPFQGEGWRDASTPAVMTEPSVAPGQTGSFTFNIKRPTGAYGDYFEYFRLSVDGLTDISSTFTLPVSVSCTFGTATNPRADGLLIRNPATGAVYLLEDGKKRGITSLFAAGTRRFRLAEAVNVNSTELGLVPDGAVLDAREGTLIKAPDSPAIYIIDEEAGASRKRLVANPAAMLAFGLDKSPVHTVSAAQASAYPDGALLEASSSVPDGLMVRSPEEPAVYLIRDGKKDWITHPLFLYGHNFLWSDLRYVTQAKLDAAPSGPNLDFLPTGTLVKANGSHAIYALEVDATTRRKRLITSPYALTESGFQWGNIILVDPSVTSGYTDDPSVECHL